MEDIDSTEEVNLLDYAERCRWHDWSYAMSDDGSVYRRGQRAREELKRLAKTSSNHERVWRLASGYHAKFTGGWTFEDGWRWSGAYLWCHRITTITEEEAQTLVAPEGTIDRYDRDVSGLIDWKKVDEALKSR